MKRKWNTLKEHIRYQLDKAEDEIWIIVSLVSAFIIILAAISSI